jgi:RNA polymerase sigma-54 factor
MDLGLSQTLKQIQTLSPQMYMSMEILQMNSLDLEEKIETELEENVALELADAAPRDQESLDAQPQELEAPAEVKTERSESPAGEDPMDADATFERKVEQWDEIAREEYYNGARFGGSSYDPDRDDKLEALQNTEGRPVSLAEHLEGQIHLLSDADVRGGLADSVDPALLRDLCVEIIYNLDARGYLLYPIEEILPSVVKRLREEQGEEVAARVDLDVLRRALEVVQSLDPPGIGGRDLKECLLLQLRRDRQAYPIETRIIESHLDDLANNRLPKIAKALGVTLEEAKTASETIASLNPLPGKLFGGETPHYIRPDVIVEEIDGRLEVRLENDYLPRLRVSDYYRNLYKDYRKDPEVKKFIKKKLESAEWLLSAIRQRQSTLERIAREIVAIQEPFFRNGISHLKPLKMQDVAERVGVHVSTISRAISGKYVQSPQGLHDLKFFFTGGAQKDDGTLEARGSVIQRIKELVDKEDKQSPLSDIDIVKKLEVSGIHISRRTVTKYREAEGIPSSRQRRAY